MNNSRDQELLAAAHSAREFAYAPYSRFKVGAALLLEDGRVVCGANIENISFGLTICAERVAVGAAVLCGCTAFERLALFSDSDEPVVPCGACRQVLAEFAPELGIVSQGLKGKVSEFNLGYLLPSPRQGILR
ncbi:MAG: cytidine deaminase [Verrucomicrobiota bacterium]|nr:cytidine deaminase [Verrucomicrobiota bacterium]